MSVVKCDGSRSAREPWERLASVGRGSSAAEGVSVAEDIMADIPGKPAAIFRVCGTTVSRVTRWLELSRLITDGALPSTR